MKTKKNNDYILSKKDFYPPQDNRTWKSNIRDVYYIEDADAGDNFADYCEEFFKILEEEEYFEH